MILFLENRIEEEFVYFDPAIYARRKEVAEKRLKSVTEYVLGDDICRSRQLLSYFGETESPACGKCDVCLKQARTAALPASEFETIAAEIIRLTSGTTLSIKDILFKLSSKFDEDRIVEVVRKLIDDRKIKEKIIL